MIWTARCTLAAILCSTSINSASANSQKKAETPEQIKRRETKKTLTSYENRSQVKCCGPFLSVSIIGVGAGLTVQLSPQWQIEYMRGIQSLILSTAVIDAFHARTFLGNSFNVFFGAGRYLSFSHHGPASEYRFGPSIGIAHDWIFDKGVTLGVDWISLEANWPVFARIKLGVLI